MFTSLPDFPFDKQLFQQQASPCRAKCALTRDVQESYSDDLSSPSLGPHWKSKRTTKSDWWNITMAYAESRDTQLPTWTKEENSRLQPSQLFQVILPLTKCRKQPESAQVPLWFTPQWDNNLCVTKYYNLHQKNKNGSFYSMILSPVTIKTSVKKLSFFLNHGTEQNFY